MSMEIRDGTLSAKLLRPIHPLFAFAAEHLAAVPDARAGGLADRRGAGRARRGTAWRATIRRWSAVLLASLVGAWLLIFFIDGAARRARVLRRERDGRLRALARRPRDLLRLPDPARGAARLGQRARGACCRSASCSRSRSRCWSACCRPRPGAAPAGRAVAVRGADGALGALRAWRAGVRRFAAFGG